MLKRAGKYDHLYLVLGDARILPFKDNVFDVIVAVDSLHHVRDYRSALSEISRTGRNKFFAAEFCGRNPLGKMFTTIERFFLQVAYRKPDEFSREALLHNIEGDYEYISSFEYFFQGKIR